MVASTPFQYNPNSNLGKPQGIMHPTNIVKNGGYYYMFMQSAIRHGVGHGLCLYRTKNVADPASWRAWKKGKGFAMPTIDPYTDVKNRSDYACDQIPSLLANGVTSLTNLTYNTVLKSF